MTPQEERNRRFDDKFGSNVYEQLGFDDFRMIDEEVKDFLTSEVNLAIEQVEKWATDVKCPDYGVCTIDEVYEEGFNKACLMLLSFLTTLKK